MSKYTFISPPRNAAWQHALSPVHVLAAAILRKLKSIMSNNFRIFAS